MSRLAIWVKSLPGTATDGTKPPGLRFSRDEMEASVAGAEGMRTGGEGGSDWVWSCGPF